jgi:hypothetical protein
MITYIFYYVSIGVLFNFLFDKVIDYLEQEQIRFTTMERIITSLLWPIAVLVFVYNFIKSSLGK